MNTFFSIVDFNKEFLDKNFDEILESTGNNLVNSNDIYLKYKQIYIEETNANKLLFENLNKQINELTNKINPNSKKISYIYINESELEYLKYKRKMLFASQQTKLSNFLHYINQLNSDKKYNEEEKSDTQSIKSNKSKKFRFFKIKK